MINSKDINMLRADVAVNCLKLIELSKKQGIDIIITSTVRDDEYQAQLYAQGRTVKGAVITNLELPAFHWVKAGLAFDFLPIVNGKGDWTDKYKFLKVADIAKNMGFTWGGDWKGLVDMPHLQWDNRKQSKNKDVRELRLPPPMPVFVEASAYRDIVQKRFGLDDATMKYLDGHAYNSILYEKLSIK